MRNGVLACLTRFCRVCEGTRRMHVTSLLGIPTGATVWCPHCFGVAGRPAAVPDLDFREDLPRDVTA